MEHFRRNKKIFEQIYRDYYQQIYRVAYYISKDAHLAEDVLQESFVKIFKNLNSLQDENKFEAWLIKITTNTALTMLSKRKIRNQNDNREIYIESEFVCDLNVESTVEVRELEKVLYEHILHLPLGYRTVLLMSIEGLSLQEISNEIDIKVGTVKSRLSRARKKLKKLYNTNFNR